MSPIAVFRCSLVLSPAAAAAGAVYALAAASRFSQDWQDLLAWNGDGSWLPLDESQEIGGVLLLLAGAFAALVAAVANQVAMFFFWPPSRHIYALLCVISF